MTYVRRFFRRLFGRTTYSVKYAGALVVSTGNRSKAYNLFYGLISPEGADVEFYIDDARTEKRWAVRQW